MSASEIVNKVPASLAGRWNYAHVYVSFRALIRVFTKYYYFNVCWNACK